MYLSCYLSYPLFSSLGLQANCLTIFRRARHPVLAEKLVLPRLRCTDTAFCLILVSLKSTKLRILCATARATQLNTLFDSFCAVLLRSHHPAHSCGDLLSILRSLVQIVGSSPAFQAPIAKRYNTIFFVIFVLTFEGDHCLLIFWPFF